MHNDDKKYSRSDYLLGNVDPYDMEVPYTTSSTFEELFKTKPKEKVVKQPIRKGNANKLLRPTPPLPRPALVKGAPGQYSLAEPAKKLKQLKETIHRTGSKPNQQQLQQYYELNAEIERRGDSYMQKLADLYNEGDSNEQKNTRQHIRTGNPNGPGSKRDK